MKRAPRALLILAVLGTSVGVFGKHRPAPRAQVARTPPPQNAAPRERERLLYPEPEPEMQRSSGIRGRVLLPDGTPAQDAAIDVEPIDDESGMEEKDTDEDGTFEFDLEPGTYRVTAEVESGDGAMLADRIEELVVEENERLDGVELRLRAAGSVVGEVIFAEGSDDSEHGEEVSVCAKASRESKRCLSESRESEFELTKLPLEPLWIVATARGVEVAERVTPPVEHLELRMPPLPVLTGRVVDRHGEAVANAQVQVTDDASEPVDTIFTDEDGKFRVAVNANQRLRVSARSGSGASPLLDAKAGDDVQLVLGEGSSICGRVVDATPQTMVELSAQGGSAPDVETPNAAGDYCFDHLPPGHWHVTLNDSATVAADDELPSLDVVLEGTTRYIPDLAQPAMARIDGRLLGADGRPITGRVLVSAGERYGVVAALQGSFEVRLHPGAEVSLIAMDNSAGRSTPVSAHAGDRIVLQIAAGQPRAEEEDAPILVD